MTLSCGKPVIVGNKGGSAESLMDGELGILVDPDNPEEIKHAIIGVLKGTVDKKFFNGEYLRKRVIEVYGFDKFKERLETFISIHEKN